MATISSKIKEFSLLHALRGHNLSGDMANLTLLSLLHRRREVKYQKNTKFTKNERQNDQVCFYSALLRPLGLSFARDRAAVFLLV